MSERPDSTPRARRPAPLGRSPAAARERRSPGALAASVLAHVVVVALVLQALLAPGRLISWLRVDAPAVRQERIVYVEPRGTPAPAPPLGGGSAAADDAPTSAPRAPAPFVAPVETPDALPAPPAGPVGGSPDGVQGGVLGGRGRGGPTEGLTPRLTDPRLWGKVEPAAPVARTPAERVDSVISYDLERVRDSLVRAAIAAGRDPADWTFERDGEKWGIDSRAIRLGRFSIPTALLGLLPINAQANPQALERERALAENRRQIDYVERRRETNATIREQIKDIRQRRDRERALERERRRVKSGESPAGVGSEPPR